MKKQSTHTPTPWKLSNGVIWAEDRSAVVINLEDCLLSEANAAFIVRAVNAYQPMVEALKEVKAVFESAGATEVFKDQYAVVCNALAQAEYK